MRVERCITAEPDKVPGGRVIREIPGQGFEVEWDVPDPEPVECKVLTLLKRVADKLQVEYADLG